DALPIWRILVGLGAWFVESLQLVRTPTEMSNNNFPNMMPYRTKNRVYMAPKPKNKLFFYVWKHIGV
ncbi:MAG: hypothetical protein VB855_09925, partial [Pirellulaceae bacterium]